MASTAEDILRSTLDEYGLASLTQWAMDALAKGLSETQVLQSMRDTPEFQARFPAIKMREQQGLAPLSPSEYVEYERRAAQTLRDAGLPPSFYDQPSDFTALLVADKSVAELQQTIQDGYQRVAQSPPEVRAAFKDWFGPGGDSALASFFLDPTRARPILTKMAEEAVFGGTGARLGVNVDEATARQAVEAGVSGQAQQGFEQLNQMSGYFDETVSEGRDLRKENEGVDAVFGLSGAGADAVRRRQEERQAAFGGWTGQAPYGGGAGQGPQGDATDYQKRV